MDFTLDSTATAVADVATDVLRRHQPVWDDRFVASPGFEGSLWSALVAAGVAGLPLPEAHGGDGVGVLGLAPLLRALGEHAAVTPAIGTIVAGIAAGEGDAAARIAEILAVGGHIAVAVSEPGAAITASPQTTSADDVLTGTKVGVLHAEGAAAILVTTDAGAVLVDAGADGVRLTRTTTSSGWGEYSVAFDRVALRATTRVAADARTVRDLYRVALAAYADGLVAGATRITADHVTNREQFGRPIGTFQAVSQQLADVYVVARSMNLAVTAAMWRLSEGLDADRDLALATWWLAAELPATVRTMTHLHGGVGVDITYPLHRYFSVVKDLARLVGGPTARLDELAEQEF
ncbi:acyl-CoA dehydrogenase family protein [Williamsia deligens]|uniref:Acyl-CoA dehydrogenase family protein n=1 Tax=Williamsia deligens TaxID=321325 RepID=A0ABW3G819_9NOCA|nr:acyl-CoA dehydrogenase family protein [Williamsia deligens]MCP2193009.1 Acyl-CoA dehydrogenase [Williamsia deligens]